MEELAGTAVRVTPERRRADEWAVVLAAGGIRYRLRHRLDGWALVVAGRDAAAALETLDAYDRENPPDAVEEQAPAAPAPTPVPGAAAVGVVVGLLLLGLYAATGSRADGSAWFARGSADAERIVASEGWRTITALTRHADAGHVLGNAAASALLIGAVTRHFGPGIGLWLLLLAGAGGNLLTALVHRGGHVSVGASTAIFGAIGLLAAARALDRGPRSAGPRRWVIVAASLALLALLGASADADLLAHLFGLAVGGALGLALAVVPVPSLRPAAQWWLAAAALLAVVAAWLRAWV